MYTDTDTYAYTYVYIGLVPAFVHKNTYSLLVLNSFSRAGICHTDTDMDTDTDTDKDTDTWDSCLHLSTRTLTTRCWC